jgi:hypothetical protein
MVTAVVADSEGLLDRDMFNDLSDQDEHQKANAS